MGYFLVILVSIYCNFVSCCRDIINYRPGQPVSKEKLSQSNDRAVCRLASKKYGLGCMGIGFESEITVKKLRGKDYIFYSTQVLNHDEGRELLVKLTLDILNIYNTNLDYRKHLYYHPWNIQNLILTVFSKQGKATEFSYPKIKVAKLMMRHLHFEHLEKIKGEVKGKRNYDEPDYEELNNKESFRMALNKIKDTLSDKQLKIAEDLGLFDGKLEDEESDTTAEAAKEIETKELYLLSEENNFKEGRISDRQRDLFHKSLRNKPHLKWEKDMEFFDKYQKALYEKKMAYLRGEREWED